MHGLVAVLLVVAAVAQRGPIGLVGAQAFAAHERTAVEVSRCNGSEALCGRRLDQVTFPGAHNAMSAQADGWLWPNQAEGIPAQLQAGIRAFLIDTHYWEVPGEVPVVLGQTHETIASWFMRRTEPPQRRKVFLCHGPCGGGSILLVEALRGLRRFLDDEPGQVVILAIEDHVRPIDTERVFREAGLLSRVYVHPLGAPWPTLGELVASGQQVVVHAENAGRSSAWYGPMYREVWDTPYRVASAADFTCERARGDTANALLLLNHWTTRPDVTRAAEVNSAASLLAHVRQCVEQHHRVPNILAVNFATVGDVVATAAVLNTLPARE